MSVLDPSDLRAIKTIGEFVLCQALLLGVTKHHRALSWGSRSRKIALIADGGKTEELTSSPPVTLRSMTRTVESLAAIGDRRSQAGRFEFVVGESRIPIDVEIAGEGLEKLVVLRLSPNPAVCGAATSLLTGLLDTRISIISAQPDEVESDRIELRPRQEKGSRHPRPRRLVRHAWGIVACVFIGPFVHLLRQISRIPCARFGEHSRTLNAGCAAILSLETRQPIGLDPMDWCGAVNLTLMAYVESFGESDLRVMRRINGELEGVLRQPIDAATLIGFWDRLAGLGPRSRAFIERHRPELMEYLGGPILL